MRVRTRRQYQRISKQSKRYVGSWIVVNVCPNHTPLTRLGMTVSRRYGIAVKRNRFKRVVREAFRLCYSQLQMGFDINIKPRTTAYCAKLSDIQAELLNFLGSQTRL